MKRLLICFGLLLAFSGAASAQNTQCPTRPTVDATNACASTAFVHNVAATISAGVTSFNTRVGAVVLSALDVTTALGYTPQSTAFQQADTGSIATTVNLKLATQIDVKNDFCGAANVNGTSDNSTCVQAAVTAACARSFPPTIYFSYGQYKAHDITQTCSAKWASDPGTRFDFSDSVAFGLQVQPSGWPSVTQSSWIYRFEIKGFEFYQTSGANVGIVINGCSVCRVEQIHFTGTGNGMISLYGGYKNVLDQISGNYYKNIGSSYAGNTIYLHGDMAGKSRAGGACTLGDCSTRLDQVTITNVDVQGTSTGAGILIDGTVDTVRGEHIDIANKNNGIQTSCSAGFASISYCPQFITFTELNVEGTVNEPAYLQDFTDFQCFSCYLIGAGSGSNHALDVGFTNYSQAGGAGGGVKLYGGRIGNVGSSCGYVNVTDILIDGVAIINCNLSNIGAYGLDFNTSAKVKVVHNTFCTFLGAAPAQAYTAVNFNGASVIDVITDGNIVRGCTSASNGTPGGTWVNVNWIGP